MAIGFIEGTSWEKNTIKIDGQWYNMPAGQNSKEYKKTQSVDYSTRKESDNKVILLSIKQLENNASIDNKKESGTIFLGPEEKKVEPKESKGEYWDNERASKNKISAYSIAIDIYELERKYSTDFELKTRDVKTEVKELAKEIYKELQIKW